MVQWFHSKHFPLLQLVCCCFARHDLSERVCCILFSFEGPVLVPEGQSHSPTSPSPQLEEMEPRLLEFEQDPPNWRELASPEALSILGKKETKRQEVINGTDDRSPEHRVRRMP